MTKRNRKIKGDRNDAVPDSQAANPVVSESTMADGMQTVPQAVGPDVQRDGEEPCEPAGSTTTAIVQAPSGSAAALSTEAQTAELRAWFEQWYDCDADKDQRLNESRHSSMEWRTRDKGFKKLGIDLEERYLDWRIARKIGISSADLFAANKDLQGLSSIETHMLLDRYCGAPDVQWITAETDFTSNEATFVRKWLVAHGLVFLNSRQLFWQALSYFIGTNLLESFSIDAVEAAADALAVHYAGGEGRIELSQEAYASLKVVRAIRQQRDLQLKQRKLRLIQTCIPGTFQLTGGVLSSRGGVVKSVIRDALDVAAACRNRMGAADPGAQEIESLDNELYGDLTT